MTTLEHRPPDVTASAAGSSAVTDCWTAALKFYATGRTAGNVRAQADTPEWVAGLAYIDGITPEAERYAMLSLADCMDAIVRAGLTPEQAYNLAGLDRVLGVPFAEFTPDLLRAP